MPNDADTIHALRKLQRFIINTRHDKRLTQAALAARAGISKGTIAFLESPTYQGVPRQPTLIKLAKGLGVQYAVLDRIIRGLPPEPDAVTETTANLLDACSPGVRALLLEYATWPDHLQSAFESGLGGLVAGIRRAHEP